MSQEASGKSPPPTPATNAFMDAALQMHRDMAVSFKNDADADFAQLLAANQKGAADLARVQLQYGHDPELRAVAERVLASQQQDLAALKAWQDKHR